MKWIKKGLIYRPENLFPWQKDRAIGPLCDLLSENELRIYFATRDNQGRSTPIYLNTDPESPEKIRSVCGKPMIDFGKPGSFDDNGIFMSSLVKFEGKKYLYYAGWNQRISVPYHLAIGLAISDSDGIFRKFSDGPLLDRSTEEPFFNTAPYVIKDDDGFKMWYVSCTSWMNVDGHKEPVYHIKYATSENGIDWNRTGHVSIPSACPEEAIGKPYVYKENGLFKMIYSFRGSMNYRTDRNQSYHLGYAESYDGMHWIRQDDKVGIALSDNGWDSMMMEYACGYVYKGIHYLVYNGNGFGESGFGYAISEGNG